MLIGVENSHIRYYICQPSLQGQLDPHVSCPHLRIAHSWNCKVHVTCLDHVPLSLAQRIHRLPSLNWGCHSNAQQISFLTPGVDIITTCGYAICSLFFASESKPWTIHSIDCSVRGSLNSLPLLPAIIEANLHFIHCPQREEKFLRRKFSEVAYLSIASHWYPTATWNVPKTY